MQNTSYEIRISDWSSDVCSSDLGAQAFIRRTGEGAEHAGPPISFDLAVPGGDAKSAKETSYHDLTAHPWAGLPVTVQLLAKDALEQVGVSATQPMVLPERVFRHPVAPAIVELRKQLSLNPLSRDGVRDSLSKTRNEQLRCGKGGFR